jgi:hypothetical protein
MCRLSWKLGILNLLEPSRPVQACNGIALPFTGFKYVLESPRPFIRKWTDPAVYLQSLFPSFYVRVILGTVAYLLKDVLSNSNWLRDIELLDVNNVVKIDVCLFEFCCLGTWSAAGRKLLKTSDRIFYIVAEIPMGACRIQVKTLPLEVIRAFCIGHDDVSYNTKTPVHTSLSLSVRAAHFDCRPNNS